MTEPELRGLGERLRRLALGMTTALLTARFLFPGEDADDGTGLGWVLAVLATLGLAALAFWASGGVCLRRSAVDAAVLVLVVLVALSIAAAADRRTAITLAWEWTGLGVLYLLLRNLPRPGAEVQALLGVLVAVAVAVSACGLYQVLVEDPLTRRIYERDPISALRVAGINPEDATIRALYEDRLLGSREPRAPYVLANSLAGVLVGPLVVGLAVALENALRRPGRGRRLVALALATPPLLLVLACLLLTKSRSAYLGLMGGLLVSGAMLWGRVGARRLAVVAGALGLILAVLIGLGVATGQLDREVLTEASKSLRYRAEYWIATWGLITESWRTFLFGVGPGNFAGPYLRHKLATSSEEIVDPHNLLLEAWSSSGLFAALALLTALVLALRETLGPTRLDIGGDRATPAPGSSAATPRRGGALPVWLGAAGGWLLVVALGHVNPFEEDMRARWLVLGAAGATGALLLGPLWRRRPVPGWALGAGALAVMINLLAAGSLSFPPVALGLWTLVALGQNLRDDRPCGPLREVGDRWAALGLAGAAAALLGLFLGGVVLHDWRSEMELAEGRAALAGPRPDFDRALAAFVRAARADAYSAEPWLAIADLEFRRWVHRGSPPRRDVWIRIATALDRASRPPRDPNALGVQRLRIGLLSRLLELRGPAFDDETRRLIRSDLAEATAEAVRLYPTSAALRARRAEASAAAGQLDLAAREAREALRLDTITPHRDKKLPEDVRRRLRNELPKWETPAGP